MLYSPSIPTAIIYCHSTIKPEAGIDDLLILKQEHVCRKYAGQEGIEIAKVFTDPGVLAAPKERPGFMEMVDYAKDAEKPVMILVETYAAISTDQSELIKAFYLLKNQLGAQIYDVNSISEDLMMKRFLQQARLEKSLINLMEYLQAQEQQFAHYYNELYDITNEMELIP